MHKIFGVKENVEYFDREGAYLIPWCNDRVGVIRTPKGCFFLGGGLECGESHAEGIARECLEEAGYSAAVGEKICSAEMYGKHPTIGYFHPIQTYYSGELIDKAAVPTETDHIFCWMEYGKLQGKMFLEMQNWALEQSARFMQRKQGNPDL